MHFPLKKIFWIAMGLTIFILGLYTFLVLSSHFLKWDIPAFLFERFDINAEGNLPAWYSSVLLLCVSITSWFLFRLSKEVIIQGYKPQTDPNGVVTGYGNLQQVCEEKGIPQNDIAGCKALCGCS